MASRDQGSPNVLFILSDDQGQWAAGCYGNQEIITPSIDSLAASGVRLDNFFCASPVCSPARASLLTGRIPSQHGIHDWLSGGNTGKDATEYLRGLPGYTDALAEAGYLCGLSGKWHLGDSFNPQKSHQHWYAHQKGGGPYYGAPMIRNGEGYEEAAYLTDAITDDALGFISRSAADDRPFYLGVHYTAPHSPWIDSHPQDLLDLYESCEFASCPDEPFHPWFDNGIRWSFEEQSSEAGWEATRKSNLQGYFAAVTGMDRGIGRMLESLRANDLEGSTIVVFTSDNGMNMGHHGVWGKGNGTYPQNMYDTSVKVPFIIRQPGRLPEGAVEPSLVSAYDFAPTLLDMLDIDSRDFKDPPGRSFRSLMEGPPDAPASEKRRELVVYDEYGPVRMIRTEEWKYVHRYFYGPNELYDLVNDPGERRNLVDEPDNRKKVDELADRLDAWFDRWVDPERDGSRQPVSGMGQEAPVWAKVPAFAPFPRKKS